MKNQNIKIVAPKCLQNYWFGYYDVTPWSLNEKSFVCMRSGFMDRPPQGDDIAEILLFCNDNFVVPEKIGETLAWNWQMGCRLQWNPLKPNSEVYYNNRQKDRFVCIKQNIKNRQKQIIEHPVYALSRSGKFAATLDFSRLHDCRPGYGYHGFADRNSKINTPDDDGLYIINMDNGSKKMILSIKQITAFEHSSDMDGCKHWINHVFWGPGDRRILFLHRWMNKNNVRITRLMTVDPAGTSLKCLGKSPIISHFDWQHEKYILIWAEIQPYRQGLYMINESTGEIKIIEDECFYTDGHCSWSPDKKWILTDTYPSAEKKLYQVFLYYPETQIYNRVAIMQHPLKYRADCRCDLHPRWNRNGTKVCFDAVIENSRKVCIADVSMLIKI
jgi:hypothetical protein